jgi:gliding motility-associated-like protein
MKRQQLVTLLAILLALPCLAQVPVITSIDTYLEAPARKVTIAGTNFGTTLSDVKIYFGAQQGDVMSVTDGVIEVKVPAGATLEQISVTNTVTQLTTYSREQFLPSYGGLSPFSTTTLDPQKDFNGESGLFDFCLCDFDADGKTDVASTGATNFISILRNTSPDPSNVQFTTTPFSIGAKSLHVRCGDLNGDGKKDLVVSEADPGERVFILTNTSTTGSISFTQQSITLSGKGPKQLEIIDLNLDGKPELIVTDQKSANKDLLVLRNTTTTGAITFAAAQSIIIPTTGTSGSSDALSVHDLNSDDRPEIIISQFLTANGNVFIFRNESSGPTLRFEDVTTLTLSGATAGLRVGDLTGDGKPEIAATQLFTSSVVVFESQSTESEIAYADGKSFTTDVQPWGLDVGDLDGDGKADIVVASLSTSKLLSLLVNTSTPGNLSFSAKQSLTTNFVNRHVRIGDVSGDGKPEIVFASVDHETVGPASKISVFRNAGCIVPKIFPSGPVAICSSFPIPLEASVSAGATYVWKKNGAAISGATGSSYSPIAPDDVGMATYTVDITSDGCTKTSAATNAEVIVVGSLPAPTMTDDGPTCKDATLTMGAASAGADGYQWTGPAGYTATGTAATRTNFEAAFSGRYEVNVMKSGCIAQKGFVIAEMITLPEFNASYSGSDLICAGDSRLLTAAPVNSDFTYQWFEKDSGPIGGQTTTSLTVDETGEYYFEAQSVPFPTCPPAESGHAVLRVVSLPSVAFTSPASTCVEMPVTFTNESVLETDADAGANFLWDFGDGGTSTGTSPTHAYAATGNFNVKLIAAYRGNSCATQLIKPISVGQLPVATITTAGGVFQFCPGQSITLGVSAPFASYLWSTNATTPTIEVSSGGMYSVKLTNDIGCYIQPSQAVALLEAPVVTATADPATINIGGTTLLTATPGLASYAWTPATSLNDASIATPIAKPEENTSYTVIATNAAGCSSQAQVTVEVTFDEVVNLLQPGNFISPNGDGINDTWEVGSISNFPQCGVKIFNEEAAKVFEAMPYLNDWDGSLNGKPLPNGEFFFFIQCEGESQSKSGSITVIH